MAKNRDAPAGMEANAGRGVLLGLARNSKVAHFRENHDPSQHLQSFAIDQGEANRAAVPATDHEARIAELAQMDLLRYELARNETAEAFGIRATVLDKLVQAARSAELEVDGVQGVVEELAPWETHVDGAALADAIYTRLCFHVTFADDADPIAATIWVFGTFLMDVWRLWPKVSVSSPTKRCGKSTLLEVIEAHVNRPFLVANVSTAAIFRTIEVFHPTFLIDEADTFLAENVEAGGILNAGHTRRTAYVVRLVGDHHDPKKFSVWCPQVIAGIGKPTDTLIDRSIRIDLKRQLPTERKDRLPVDLFERCEPTRRKLLRWSQDNAKTIGAREGMPPNCGNDRAQDNWTPLFHIADVIGGVWPDRVHSAYLLKERPDAKNQDDDTALMLLTDMHKVFEMKNADRVSSEDMHLCLTTMNDRPWAEWARGSPITKAGIARAVKAFGVRTRKVRIGAEAKQGYHRSSVQDAFTRYVPADPPFESGTPEQGLKNNGLNDFKSGTDTSSVPLSKPSMPLKINECSGVPLSEEDSANEAITEAISGVIDVLTDHDAHDPDLRA